jgi:hypothetical protein
MSHTLTRYTATLLLFCVTSWSLLANTLPENAFASDVPCRFKAATEPTEIHVMANGKTLWTGPIEKLQTRTISIPEGPFTIISKVYNENLKAKEDVRAETHTRQCRDNAVLTVPLFQESQESQKR